MKGVNDNEHIFLQYIDGKMDIPEAEALRERLDQEPELSEELFESKHIADMARYGNMDVRKQERHMLELLARMKASDKRRRMSKIFTQVLAYAAVICFAFFAGALTLGLHSSKDGTIVVQATAGNKSDVILPDGTRITLKSSSVLEYDISAFESDQRVVRLDGEAYFDVASDPDSEFIVQTGRQDVTVHGTIFNLRAYSSDSHSILTLLEGSVTTSLYSETFQGARVVKMNCMERCICNMKSGKVVVERVDPSELGYKWDENICYFKDKTLRHIVERLQVYYDTEILIDDSVDGRARFTGAVYLNEPVTEVLELINYDKRYHIISNDDKYTISINNHN